MITEIKLSPPTLIRRYIQGELQLRGSYVIQIDRKPHDDFCLLIMNKNGEKGDRSRGEEEVQRESETMQIYICWLFTDYQFFKFNVFWVDQIVLSYGVLFMNCQMGRLLGFWVCWLNSWAGQNSGSSFSCISYLEKHSEDRRLEGLYEESLKVLE